MATYEVRIEIGGGSLTTEIEIDEESPYYQPTEQHIYNEIMDSLMLEWDKVSD